MQRADGGNQPEQPNGRRVTSGRGAADRVRLSHAQTRATLRVALVFLAAAAVSAPIASSRWLPLHLFLAGGVMLAISGVTLMLTVTWAAAPAPSDRWATVQRWCIAAGATGVAVGREGELADIAVGIAGGVYLLGMVLLGGLLFRTIRRGVARRFDMAVAAYLVALAAGTTGVAFGVVMAADTPSITRRGAHVTLNLLGLVGLIIAGTMPYFAATVGRSRMSRRAQPRNLAFLLGWLSTGLAFSVIALMADAGTVAAFGFVGYALGVLAMLWLLPRPTRRQFTWAGPRLLALWCGGLWWVVSLVASAIDAASGERMVFGGRWVLVLTLGGYAQILWGSLAYLLPMLRAGGHELLAEGFAWTRSWLGFASVNIAAVSIATGLPGSIAAAAVTVWVVDTAWRIGTVLTDRQVARRRGQTTNKSVDY